MIIDYHYRHTKSSYFFSVILSQFAATINKKKLKVFLYLVPDGVESQGAKGIEMTD